MRSKLKFTLALLLAMAMVAAACGDSDEIDTTGLATIESGKLTVGSDIPFPPFEDFDAAGNVIGFDAEVIEGIAQRLNLEVKWVDTDFDTIFTQLATATFDVVASATTITAARDEIVNFTDRYYKAQQALAINEDETPNIDSVDDLGADHSVAVQTGTTGEIWANDNLAPKGVAVRGFPAAPDTVIALEGGQVDGVVFDEPFLVEEAAKRPSLKVVDAMDTGENYGFGVDPANAALLTAMNQALAEMIDDGTYEDIFAKWFGDATAGSVAE